MIILIASSKGRTGKTTVSTNLILSIGDLQFFDYDVEEPNANIYLKAKINEHEDGLLDKKWIELCCKSDWENCVRYYMEESGKPHEDYVLPDETNNKKLE